MSLPPKITYSLNKKAWIVPTLFGLMCFFLISAIIAIEVRKFTNILPSFAFSIGGELFATMVSLILTASILPANKRQSGQVRLFVTLLTVGCFTLYVDTIQMVVDGLSEFIMLNKIMSVLIFVGEAFFVFFFWYYVTYSLKAKGKLMDVFGAIASISVLIFILLPFVNFFYPLYFSIDENGVYARTEGLWWIGRIYVILLVVFIVGTLIVSKERARVKGTIITFLAFPIFAVVAGGYKYGISVLFSSMMLSIILIYTVLFSENEKRLYSKSKELGIATNIQKHMVPFTFPAFPGREEFDIYALMEPAKEVGGDFYDFFLIDDTHLGVVMADVSDKGVPAALFMMASKIMVQNYAMMGLSPKQTLAETNRRICSNNQDQMFVTVWFGILDTETGILTASNGGHERPLLKRADGSFEVYKDKHGFVVGGMAESVYSEYEIKMEPGCKLFLYTDGVPEGMNQIEVFGMERVIESLRKHESSSPEDILKGVYKDLTSFTAGAEQFDDITMLCLEYKGKGKQRLVVPAEKEVIEVVVGKIVDSLKEKEVDRKIVYKVEMAVEEILANVVSYAYAPGKGDVEVEYGYIDEGKTICIQISDEGKPFNPLELEAPDINLPAEERKIGGLGLFLVGKTMDEINYDRKGKKNVLIIKKKII